MSSQIEIPMEVPKSKNIPRPDWENLKEDYWGYVADFVEEWGIARYKNREDNLADIREVFQWEDKTTDDAYEISKRFEYEGWDVDSDFVDAIGSLDSFENSVGYRKKIKAWVDATECAPPLEIGQEFKTDHFKKLFVKRVYPELRRYFAAIEPDGKKGYYINWEDAAALSQSKPENQ